MDIEPLPLDVAQTHDLSEMSKMQQKISCLTKMCNELQAEFNLLTMVFDTTDALVVMVDRDGVILRSNRSFYSRFMVSGENIIGENLNRFAAVNAGSMVDGDLFSRHLPFCKDTEVTMVGKNDERYVISWSCEEYRDENDITQYIVLTGTDITTRKQYESLLEREKGLFQSLIDSIDDLIFFKDLTGKYIGCNEAFESMVGIGREQIIGKTDFDLLSLANAELYAQYDSIVLDTRETVRYENTSQKTDDVDVVFETRKCPYYDQNEELLGVIGVVRDITKQKTSEAALRKAHAETSQLIASLTSILIVVSDNLEIVQWNNAAEKVFGLSANEVLGKTLPDTNIQLDWTFLLEHVEKCRNEKRAKYLDPFRFTRQNGAEGFLGFNISPVFDQNSDLSGFILLGGDITQRKASEAQTSQAQKLKSIGQLAAGIAHEINTPIQYIGDNVQFLRDGFDGLWQILQKYETLVREDCNALDQKRAAEIEETAKNIDLDFLRKEIPLAIEQSLDGIERVSEIVSAMKNFSHPGLITKLSMDINKAIEDTVTVARNEWKYVAEVNMDLDPGIPPLMCIPGEINQVLLNVTINAVQAIEDSLKTKIREKGEITYSTGLAGEFVEIHIKDTGPGIPRQVRSRIFEPFFTTKEVGKGTGQGLAIAYDIVVNKHGGEITFESRMGEGTTFIIRLPTQSAEVFNGEEVTMQPLGEN